MTLGTIVIGFIVLGVLFLAARSIYRDKKSGKACGSCSGCSCGNCECHSAGPEEK